ncbi:Sigma-fimbriae usher protein [Cronobacter sakazakii 696]|nr:Sigma-fimbriae usher protein [Cronobacter sakazakii 696]
MIISLLCVVSPTVYALEGDDALPPPPDAQAIDRQAVFHLSLVVNYYDTGLVVPVTRRGGAMWVSSADLQRAGLPGDKLPQGEVNVDALPQVKSRYDSTGQRLLLTVPTDWVPARTVALGASRSDGYARAPATGRCSITIFTPATPITVCVRRRSGTRCVCLAMRPRFPRPGRYGKCSAVIRGRMKAICATTPCLTAPTMTAPGAGRWAMLSATA